MIGATTKKIENILLKRTYAQGLNKRLPNLITVKDIPCLIQIFQVASF